MTYEGAVETTFNPMNMIQQPQFYNVSCPYCGFPTIVPTNTKYHNCPSCNKQYQILGPADQVQQNISQQEDKGFQFEGLSDSAKKWIIGIVAAIGLIWAIGYFSDGGSSIPTSRETEVVIAVKDYLRHNLKDPKSYEEVFFSKVGENENGEIYVRHQYRAKNSFGGYVVEDKIFFLDKNYHVKRVKDY